MKTKNKIVAMAEIAIVLCSLFLVALPVVAAEQNQEMQKASTSAITTASEDDYVLGVYGNANEDDTIDMGDVVYVKLAIFGKKAKTELCDAKYDGRINVLDVIQTKLIILGKEKEITFIDALEPSKGKLPEAVTIDKPVERIIVERIITPITYDAETLRSLDAVDKIVGVGQIIIEDKYKLFFPELRKLPSVGNYFSPDLEAVLNLKPDVLIPFTAMTKEQKEKLPGITVIFLGLRFAERTEDGVRILGYIIDKEEEAETYIDWYNGYLDKIKSRTEGLSEDEKAHVFIWGHFKPGGDYTSVHRDNRQGRMCAIAGGKNIIENIQYTGWWTKVDPEWVIEQNPDIIVATVMGSYGYGVEDSLEMAAARDDILNRPELANVNAVKNGRVYMLDNSNMAGGPRSLVGIAYMAKWFHPELFEDLDPQEIHQEYLDRFQRIDFNVKEHGVFVYPPLED